MTLVEVPVAEWAALIGALAAAGAITGLFSGLFGTGGGGVLVPILYEIFTLLGVDEAVRMHATVATSLAVIVPTSLNSYRSHLASGAVDRGAVRRIGPFVALGVLAGIAIAAIATTTELKWVYVVSCLLMALRMAIGGTWLNLGTQLPGGATDRVFGTGVGLFSTLIGIGGGSYVTTYMLLYGRSIHQAVATAAGFGPIIAIPAVLGYVLAGWGETGLLPGSLGYVSVIGAAAVVPTSVYFAPIAARAAHRLPRRSLELAFAAFLLIVALRFLFSLVS